MISTASAASCRRNTCEARESQFSKGELSSIVPLEPGPASTASTWAKRPSQTGSESHFLRSPSPVNSTRAVAGEAMDLATILTSRVLEEGRLSQA